MDACSLETVDEIDSEVVWIATGIGAGVVEGIDSEGVGIVIGIDGVEGIDSEDDGIETEIASGIVDGVVDEMDDGIVDRVVDRGASV